MLGTKTLYLSLLSLNSLVGFNREDFLCNVYLLVITEFKKPRCEFVFNATKNFRESFDRV